MVRPSPRARALLRTYRSAKASSTEGHEALWDRIEASLDAGVASPSIESNPAPRAIGITIGIAVGVAAAVALVVALSSWRGAASTTTAPSQAPHGVLAPGPRLAEPAARSGPVATSTASEPAAPRATPPRVAPSMPDVAPPGTSAPAAAAHTSASTPTRASARPPGTTADVREPAPDPAVDELRAELGLIHKARQALHADHPTRALELLDAHARTFPRGQMREDRLALRIEALCAADKGPQARAEARLFLRAFPASAHAQRVRDACSAR